MGEPPMGEEVGKAWVLDALEALDDQSFAFAMQVLYGATCALVLQEPRPETIELAGALKVYLETRGVALPF